MNHEGGGRRRKRQLERMKLSIERADQRHREIIDVAARLFAEKGYAGTTMTEIGDEVGVVGASLYYYVDSKEDLLLQVMSGAHVDGFRTWVEDIDDPVERLRTCFRNHIVFNANNAYQCRVFYQEYPRLDPERRAPFSERRKVYESFLSEQAREAQAQDLLIDSVRPELIIRTMLSSVNGVQNWFRHDGELSPEELADLHVQIMFEGVVTR